MNSFFKVLSKLTVVRSISVVMALLTLTACTNTKLTSVWGDPEFKEHFNDILVIAISESQQNRRAFESYVVAELELMGAEGVASYTLIKSGVTIDKEAVLAAIDGLDIDGVIVTHLAGVDEETVYRPSMQYSPAYSGGYYGGLYSYYPHVNRYVSSPGYYTTHETYMLETSLYDVKSEELVWTAKSRSFSPESVDEVIVDLTKLVIEDLADKKFIVEKK